MIFYSILFSICSTVFLHCSSAKKSKQEPPFSLGQTYYKRANNNVGSAIFITINNKSPQITLDSVYYKNQATKLFTNPDNPKMFIGKFNTHISNNIVMSSNPAAEYGNTPPKKIKPPVALKQNECLVSYTKNKQTKYFKIDNILEK